MQVWCLSVPLRLPSPPWGLKPGQTLDGSCQCTTHSGVSWHQPRPRIFLHSRADKIGYPVLIKASSGGGSKGCSWLKKPKTFIDALGSCQRVKPLAALAMTAYWLRNTPCVPAISKFKSLATIRQLCFIWAWLLSTAPPPKVLEESPAPRCQRGNAEAMGAAAIAAAKAVNYGGGYGWIYRRATWPFTEDKFGGMNFYFWKWTPPANRTPVTEAITGTDLVEWQLRVASGEPLPKQQNRLDHQRSCDWRHVSMPKTQTTTSCPPQVR